MKALLLLLWLLPLWSWAKPEMIRPKVKTSTAFAIVVDRQSYDKVRTAVEAYRDAIEKDGLATWILIDDWESPAEIRALLKELYEDRRMPLEGTVFVGDIPVPMIRDAQFLSSAFKMDQKRPWDQSSIPSDRYYDDFGLQFDFLKQDSIQPLYFYYSLNPNSAMQIRSDIYSGRIKPMAREGKDKYAILERYLWKVVRLKAEKNPLNDLTVARGHGYNSEAGKPGRVSSWRCVNSCRIYSGRGVMSGFMITACNTPPNFLISPLPSGKRPMSFYFITMEPTIPNI